MVTLKSAWVTLITVAFALFVISNLIDLAAGMRLLPTFVENLLGSLQVNYSLLAPGVQNNPYVLVSSFIDSLIFVIITVVLATWFFDVISGLGIRERITMSRISRIKGHVIVAPYTPLAQALLEEFKKARITAVAITEDKAEASRLYARNEMAIFGTIKSTGVFETAGIKNARCVVACSDDDLENTLIAVTAKNANPNVKIISRVGDDANIPKLSMAGAYWTIKPEITAGEKVAEEILKRVV
jgi:voltage-gated potassium channel